MGLFGDVGKILSRVGTGIVTGGTSEIIRAINPGLGAQISEVFFPTTLSGGIKTLALAVSPAVASFALAPTKYPTVLAPLNTALGQEQRRNQALGLGPTIYQGDTPMGFDLSNILGLAGNILGGVSSQPLIQGFGNALTQIATVPQVNPTMMGPVMGGMGVPVANRANVPAVRGSSLTQDVFNAGVKVLGQLGIPYAATSSSFSSALKRTLGSIASLARRTPAGTIVSILLGLGLTAFEANLLTAWHAQRKKGKRMNPSNPKALRRAARRIRSFHKLCTVADVLKSRGRSRSFSRCNTCKKSPCRC